MFAIPDLFTLKKIERTAIVLENIRDMLGGYPITFTSWWRPYHYNACIEGSSDNSEHIKGWAADFVHEHYTANEVREALKGELYELDICMENKPGASWVHIDLAPERPNSGRFFIP